MSDVKQIWIVKGIRWQSPFVDGPYEVTKETPTRWYYKIGRLNTFIAKAGNQYEAPFPSKEGVDTFLAEKENKANQTLMFNRIRNAAPELLEALEELLRVGDDKMAFRSEWVAAVTKARAAIAAAKGGE